jgi:hypothetical protein
MSASLKARAWGPSIRWNATDGASAEAVHGAHAKVVAATHANAMKRPFTARPHL